MILLFFMFLTFSMFLNLMNLSFMMEWMFMNFNSVNVEFFLMFDWISCLFISVVMLISSMIMLYSMIYMGEEVYLDRFINLVNLFILSMILMIISPNVISILFGWDGLGLTSYCLVIFYQNYMSFNSGMVTVLCNRIGDIGLLMAVSMMFSFGSWNLFFLSDGSLIFLIMMVMMAAITKSAQIPFSVWLPMAMAAPTPVSALVHSSTLVTAGVYLMMRFSKFLVNSSMDKILLYISIFTMFMSGLMANFENDLKKIIALSTLSQLGLMMMILSLGFKFLAFYHLLTHAIFKSLLFMCAGIMIHLMDNNQDIRLCGGLNEYIPFVMMSFYMSSLALMGFPFLAGFYSKDLIMEMIYMINMNVFLLVLILMSLSFTVSYSLRLMYYIFWGEKKCKSFYYYKENSLMNLSMFILMLLSLIMGSMLMWMFFFDNYFLFMQIYMKFLTIFMLILGIMINFFMSMKNLLSLYLYIYFFSSMWFMNYMYMWIYKPVLNFSNSVYNFDKSWVEFYSKNLMLNFYKEINVMNNMYKIFMVLFVILFFLLMIKMFI
uniref:NADH dehydrogenase subunit 5 n=1 Tax=Lepisiota frauenfeldi TaxID=610729 RepID=UPI001FA6CFED|nr:NADH dehydrogenase subunit 5 [Lepisiota frauenfeldi]ULM64005.1 NADH dehydrogenase subunit 5 [Lepisiota frauenfeldi]ULM64018.1 NADH dehydrogenase subunit 5 [Lepisiota frauenfeldi]WEY05524.1 NADH dehydrogenase subunit 5 [Lepisiota frauenfeldi]WEY05576.1 NADH dehydrogenase subunit 5 [Lepisiota frauenfeldi]WEY05589.1 NADH dehydrogenase subunit 5 [Lepisiota frauenfeldi]